MKLKFFLFLIIALFPVSASIASAAVVRVVSPAHISAGDAFDVLIRVDTGAEAINSIDFTITYDERRVSFAGYIDTDTVVKTWIQSPAAAHGEVSMSGIIPGGASGVYDPHGSGSLRELPLVHLLFTAEEEGITAISFKKSIILKNDGEGTELPAQEENAEITIDTTQQGNNSGKKMPADAILPRPFSVTFVESSFFSDTPSMVIFDAVDEDSGIKNYEIRIGAAPWKIARSPVPVSKRIFPYTVTVRAFDFYGNFREASIDIPGSGFGTWVILLILTIIIFVWYKFRYTA